MQEQQTKGSQAHGELWCGTKQDMEGGAEAKGTKLGQQREIKNKQLEEETKQEAAQKEAETAIPLITTQQTPLNRKKLSKKIDQHFKRNSAFIKTQINTTTTIMSKICMKFITNIKKHAGITLLLSLILCLPNVSDAAR